MDSMGWLGKRCACGSFPQNWDFLFLLEGESLLLPPLTKHTNRTRTRGEWLPVGTCSFFFVSCCSSGELAADDKQRRATTSEHVTSHAAGRGRARDQRQQRAGMDCCSAALHHHPGVRGVLACVLFLFFFPASINLLLPHNKRACIAWRWWWSADASELR